MDDSTRDRLEEIFQRERKIRRRRENERARDEQRQKSFEKRFLTVREEVIVPTLEQLGAYLRDNRFDYELEIRDHEYQSGAGHPYVQMTLYPENGPREKIDEQRIPMGVKFVGSKSSKKVKVYSSNSLPDVAGIGEGGMRGEYAIDEVDSSFVEKRVVKTVNRIVENIISYRGRYQ